MADTNDTSNPPFEISDAIVEGIRHAMTPSDENPMPTGEGLVGFELEGVGKAIVPVETPLRNMLRRIVRKAPEGEMRPDSITYLSILGFTTIAHQPASAITYNTVTLQDQPQTLSAHHPVTGESDLDQRACALASGLWRLIYQEERFLFERIAAQARHAKEQGIIRTVQSAQPGMPLEPQLQSLLRDAYADAAADPDFLFMAPTTHRRLSAEIASGNGLFEAADAPASATLGTGALVPQYRLTHLINSATGKEMPVVTSPLYPEDVALALTIDMPFPTPVTSVGVDIGVYEHDYWGVTMSVSERTEVAGAFVDVMPRLRFIGGVCLLEGIAQ